MKKLFTFFSFVFVPQFVFANFVCDTDITDYLAIYEISSYTCNSGYYLPANTEGCQPCPSGFTCDGGTFTFDSNIYQGARFNYIPNTTMNDICADNFPTDFYAVYEPNTITVNFDDESGNTQTQTCTYDGLINLPPEPSRIGYTFSGWKISNTQ